MTSQLVQEVEPQRECQRGLLPTGGTADVPVPEVY